MQASMKTLQELSRVADNIEATLKAGLSAEFAVQEDRFPIALHYYSRRYDSTLSAPGMTEMIGAYYALCLREWVDRCLRLHESLTEQGFVSEANPFNYSNDCMIFAPAEQTTGPKSPVQKMSEYSRIARAVVLKTRPPRFMVPSRFIVVLNNTKHSWDLHIREFWEDPCETEFQELPGWAKNLSQQGPLTLKAIAKYAGIVSQAYGDSFAEGAEESERPVLSTYLNGSMFTGRPGASVGLRYGDGRDPGYVASLYQATEKTVHVRHPSSVRYTVLDHVLINLECASLSFKQRHPTS